MSKLATFLNGIFKENPSFVQLLGMCPLLAISTSMKNAIGMGLTATIVLICSNAVISMLRKVIPNKIRIASYIIIIAGFVTVMQILLKAYFPAINNSLGVFIPLIVVNCIILARAETFASKNDVLLSVLDGAGTGLGFTLGLCVLSFIRELLGSGRIFGVSLFGDNFHGITMMILAPGGFLTLGIVIGIIQLINIKRNEGGRK
ncbi:MAG: electron transport complex subunit RsxE [Bacillota bacterium]|nr:electron transport complex subunit RsxE [Bacillota bacterium]